MDLELKDKLALVTGSTAGIGFAIAKALSSEGATTIVNGRSEKSVGDAIAALGASAKGEVLGFAGDLATSEGAQELYSQHPHVDILVNNLGIFEPVSFEDITDADWRRFFEVNVLSGIRLSRLYLPSMRERNWFKSYGELAGIERVFRRLASRYGNLDSIIGAEVEIER